MEDKKNVCKRSKPSEWAKSWTKFDYVSPRVHNRIGDDKYVFPTSSLDSVLLMYFYLEGTYIMTIGMVDNVLCTYLKTITK